MQLFTTSLLTAPLFTTTLFGIALTVGMFVLALALYRRIRWLHPILVTSTGVILFLLLTGIPYESYQQGGDIIVFFLGPATVALAVPLYKYYQRIKTALYPILAGVFAGCLMALGSAVAITWLFGGRELLSSIIPKTVTTPIAMELAVMLGGVPQVAAVLTVLTGLVGSVIGPQLLRWCGIKSDTALGVAIGTSAHGIGTARLLLDSESQGSVSGFAMGITGVMMSVILAILLYF
jgi:predicted murein hydrolase (TIGR00659 family)